MRKETIAVALADAGKRSEVRDYGTNTNTPTSLKALTNKLAKPGAMPRFCCEAGPCGYGIQRQLASAGHKCVCRSRWACPGTEALRPRHPEQACGADRPESIVWPPRQRLSAIGISGSTRVTFSTAPPHRTANVPVGHPWAQPNNLS